jgi:hypothetical protein
MWVVGAVRVSGRELDSDCTLFNKGQRFCGPIWVL